MRPLERFDLRHNEPMAQHTSFHIGGPAEYYLRVHSIEMLEQAVSAAWAAGMPCTILSGGSNVLVADAGIRGLVIENRCRAYTLIPLERAEEGQPRTAVLTAESGVSLPLLAGKMARAGWAGLEWAAGIPGSVGGAIIQNAGAWGFSVADLLIDMDVLEHSTGPEASQTCRWSAGQLQPGYRTSRLRRMSPDERPVVLRARFRLQEEEPEDTGRRLAGYVRQRTASQPRQPSAGSIFRNPPGDYAGRLIEAVGLKGYRIGHAQISDEHANFIVNLGQATAKDVWNLMKLAQERVQERFQIALVPEIEWIGGQKHGR